MQDNYIIWRIIILMPNQCVINMENNIERHLYATLKGLKGDLTADRTHRNTASKILSNSKLLHVIVCHVMSWFDIHHHLKSSSFRISKRKTTSHILFIPVIHFIPPKLRIRQTRKPHLIHFHETVFFFFRNAGGEMVREDLMRYQTRIREPITGRLKSLGLTMYAPEPPSSGVVLEYLLRLCDGELGLVWLAIYISLIASNARL